MKNKIAFILAAVLLVLITIYAASAASTLSMQQKASPWPVAQTFTITSTPPTTATVDSLYSYQITVQFIGGPVPLKYSVVSGPSGMTVNNAGLVTWTPSATGTYFVNLSVKDISTMDGYTEYQEYYIVVGAPAPTSMLEITKVRADIGGRTDTLTSEGTFDEDADLGDDIEIRVTVRNNLPDVSGDENDIEDIIVSLSSDLDAADGLEEEISRINPGDDKDVTFTFTLDPSEVNPADAPFDIDIDVDGETPDGTGYSDSWTVTIDMDRKSKEFYVLSAEANPTTLSCGGSNRVRVDLDLRNIGTSDITNGMLRYRMTELGIDDVIKDVALDSGDDKSYTHMITIPAGITPGAYDLEVNTYTSSNSGSVSSMTDFSIVVPDCSQGSEGTGSTGSDQTSNLPPAGIIVSGAPVATAVGHTGLFDSESPLYLILLGALIALVFLVIVFLVVRVRK
jgi:hypothetical protein